MALSLPAVSLSNPSKGSRRAISMRKGPTLIYALFLPFDKLKVPSQVEGLKASGREQLIDSSMNAEKWP
jgi:hypothetical protein